MRLILIALAFLSLSACSHSEKAAPAAPPDPLLATSDQLQHVKLDSAAIRPIDIIEEATGKVGFNEDATTPVLSPYTGRVVELLAKPGDLVKKGQPLFTIDTPDLSDAENDFLSARAGEAKAKAILTQAQRTRDRTQRLVSGEAAAQKDLEQAQTDVISAENDLKSSQSLLESSRQRLLAFNLTPAEIDTIVDGRRINRTTRVLSPLDGVIVSRALGPGQYVRPDSGNVLFTIANLSTMWLLAQVYETQVPMVQLNEPVGVQVMAFPGKSFPARVSFIGPSVDPATRRVQVRCLIQNSQGLLRPEMFATFRFEESKAQLLTIPEKAIVQDGGLQVVWVLDPRNRFERRIVQTGRRAQGFVEILSGVQQGERVVTGGALFLTRASQG